MSTVLSRWGNSLAVRIPASVAHDANIRVGDALDVRISRHGRITIAPIEQALDFGKLYLQIEDANRYGEVRIGSEQGNEISIW